MTIYILFIHLWIDTDGHLGYYQFGANMNTFAVDILVQAFLWICVFIFIEKIPRKAIVGSLCGLHSTL